MRLELEVFSFDVEHISGKKNVGADALSRIVIDSEELKNLSVLPIQTRSLTKNKLEQQQAVTESNSKHIGTDHLKVYNSINNIDAFNMNKLMFEYNNPIMTIKIKTKNLKRELALVQFTCKNKFIDVAKYLETINKMAKHLKITELALENSSIIFSIMDIQSFKNCCNKTLKDVKIILYEKAKILTNKEEIQQIVKENHANLLGGHVGINRLVQKLRRTYYWTNMRKTITDVVKNCNDCKINKFSIKTNETFIHTTTPTNAFDLVSIDTVGPLTRTNNGNRYILTIQCDLAKYVVAIPTQDKQARTLAQALVQNFILIYGCPSTIKSDMGSEYKNEIFNEVTKTLAIDPKFSTAYHPQTIGSLERNHRCLNEYLRYCVNEQQDDWDQWLPYFTFCYNTSPHSNHLFTPYELIFGKQAKYPADIKNTNSIDPVYNHDSYIAELKYKLQKSAKKAKELLDIAKKRRIIKQSEESYTRDVNLGDKIWLKKEQRKKLDPVYCGPYDIIGINHPNVIIKNCISGETQTVHKNRIKTY